LPLLPKQNNYYTKLLSRPENAQQQASSWVTPYQEIMQQPSLIKNGQMKHYQLQGLSFLAWLHANGMGGILGDEMGLGKTLQTYCFFHFRNNNRLSLFAYLRESGVKGPFLVICPLSVLAPWMAEIARWVPSFTAIRLHGTKVERERLKALCKEKEYDIYVTSYEQFVAERNWYSHWIWRYVVVDEGDSPHSMKQTNLNRALFEE
jgi:SWI/SNF-related matrix-associated actin-dependent regulator of chromatin subfamily A member 5